MNKFKKSIMKSLPEGIQNKCRLCLYILNSKKTYEQIEKQLDKKYCERMGRKIDWDAPKSFTEKLNVSKVYGVSSIKTELTDKVAARKWVEGKIGKRYLIPLIGLYDSLENVSFKDLPEQFVIKCSHDSKSATIVESKKHLSKKDISKLIKKYDKFFMKRNFAYHEFEMHYSKIPHKIIIEEYMGKNINDYKFLCFGGTPYYCWVDVNRFIDHKRNLYDLNWALQPVNWTGYGNYKGNIEKPECFEEMLEIVKKLCVSFDSVRVDLYEINGKVYFGEMTFTSDNGMNRIEPLEWDYKLGQLWDFDNNLRRNIRHNMKKPE